jgi:hypothetical protein
LKTARAIHIDHILPQVLGGRKGAKNQVACCGSCNCSKRAKLLRQFAQGRCDEAMIRRVQRMTQRNWSKYLEQADSDLPP